MVIMGFNFEMDCFYIQFSGFFLDKIHRKLANTLTPVGVFEVEFIDKCVTALVFKAESEGQNNVAGNLLFNLNHVKSTKCLI